MPASLRRWLGLVLISVALALSGGPAARAQPEVIRDIQVEGNLRIEASTIESYLTLGRGDPFDPVELERSLKNLFATGFFDDVAIERRGDVLVVRVVENPIINRIAFEGNLRIEDEELEAEVGLRPRSVFSRARVQNAVERILEVYRRSGRYAAKVEPKVIELEQNRVDLVFEIDEGPLTRVCAIAFVGNASFPDRTLRGVIETKERAWFRFFTAADTYDPDRIELDKELLRRYYRARGFAEMRVLGVNVQLSPDGACFFLTFSIEEGPRYRFGTVELATTLAELPVEELEGLLLPREGRRYDGDAVEETVQRLTEELGRLGFAFAQVEPVEDLDREAGVVDLLFRIDEGPRVYVERIEIRGNLRTLDEVIRREFRLAEGDPFNAALLRRSIQRVRNLGYFERVDVETRPGSAPDRLIIAVEVSERSTGSLSFGAGYSTTDGPLFDVQLSERNLLGRGQSLRLQLTFAGERQEADFSFTEPYFMDRELSAGIDLFHRRLDFQAQGSYNEQRTGGRLRFGFALGEFLEQSVRYTLRRVEVRNIAATASPFILQEQGTRWISAIGHTLVYDRRDSRFLPNEGYFLQLSQDLAGLGGDTRYLRNELRGEYYFPLTSEVVLSLGLSAGYILGLGEDVPLSERFFLGGASLRGFQQAGVGPRDRNTGDALGGNLYYVGTAELRFPLGLPKELRMFGRAFAEGGSLTEVDLSGPALLDSGNPRLSVGVGVSWLSPLGPLSIDFARAIIKDDEDKTESFRLTFGARF